jgi:protein involved in polysaccharide export with SLBB domain
MTTPANRQTRVMSTALAVLVVACAAIAPPASAQDAPAVPAPGGTPYVLQRGDQLSVKVFGQPELNDTVTIRPDGRISLMLVDDVQAADLTTAALDELLTTRYARYFRDPEVTVIVRTFSNRLVYVGGEVGQPKAIELTGELTALSAILQAGGFLKSARTNSVVLLRNDGQNRALIRTLDMKALLEKGEGDVALQPFDVVFVPKSRIATVDQFVDQYMRQLIPISVTAGFTYLLGGTAVIR